MLTATKQAKKGYWISELKKHIYSIEEINYFIFNHIDMVYRDFFCDELFDYIENELEQPYMARDLRNIAENNGGLEDFIKYIFNASFYYNSRELAEISSLVTGIDSLGRSERIMIKADAFYRAGNYNSAIKCYLEILHGMENESLSGNFYGRVAYAAGCAYARLFMHKSAIAYFSYAYELSPDALYSRACVYMSIMADDDEELLESIVKYKISDDELDSMRNRIESIRHEVQSSEQMHVFSQSLQEPGTADELVKQWKTDYYNMLK